MVNVRTMRPWAAQWVVLLFVGVCLSVISNANAANDASAWSTGGEDLGNTRNNEAVDLQPEDVRNIGEAWSTSLQGDPWAQPTVRWNMVFIADNAGWIYAFDAATGTPIWERELITYWDDFPGVVANDPNDPGDIFSNPKPDIAATRSAIAAREVSETEKYLYFGDQAGNPTLGPVPFNGANIYKVDAMTGDLVAMTKVAQNDDLDGDGQHPAQSGADFTVLTGAMALHDNTLITGVAGLAEANPNCQPLTAGGCTLRGRVMAFDADTLEMNWEFYTTPAVEGFTGASVWQSTPAIDPDTGTVYVGTGDNYTTPHDPCYIAIPDKDMKTRAQIEAEFLDTCINTAQEQIDWDRNFVDSVLALDINSGTLKWAFRTLMYDTWNLACFSAANGWLNTCGPDMDFSHHPMLCPIPGSDQKMLVVGQKTGQMRGLNPATGEVIWVTDTNGSGPLGKFAEGLVGGFQWGAACTHETIVGLAANSYGQKHSTKNAPDNDKTDRGLNPTTGGSIVGFDPENGQVMWETFPKTQDRVHPGLQSFAATLRGLPAIPEGSRPATIGAASCAGRVCGWGTSGKWGSLLLTDSKTGKTLWKRMSANGSVLWGGAFVELDGMGKFWYVGSGYGSFDTGVSSKTAPNDPNAPNFWAYQFPKAKKARGPR